MEIYGGGREKEGRGRTEGAEKKRDRRKRERTGPYIALEGNWRFLMKLLRGKIKFNSLSVHSTGTKLEILYETSDMEDKIYLFAHK